MDDGLFCALGAMNLSIKRQDAIARNLAGSEMTGFKRDFVVSESFKRAYGSELGEDGTGNLLGTTAGKTYIDFTPGIINRSDRKLDFAMESYEDMSEDPIIKNSQTFFEVIAPGGSKFYTRNGSFFLNADKTLVTAEGYIVSGDGGPITLGADDNPENIVVTSDGQVRLEDKTTSPVTIKNLGNMRIASVAKPQSLSRASSTYFADFDGSAEVSEADPSLFRIMNGYKEESNSSPVLEMTRLIEGSRDFELNSRMVRILEDRFRQEQTKLGR